MQDSNEDTEVIETSAILIILSNRNAIITPFNFPDF